MLLLVVGAAWGAWHARAAGRQRANKAQRFLLSRCRRGPFPGAACMCTVSLPGLQRAAEAEDKREVEGQRLCVRRARAFAQVAPVPNHGLARFVSLCAADGRHQ